MIYRVNVEYEVEADNEEAAVEKVREQLNRDDNLAFDHNESRLDFTIRKVW